MTRGARTHGLDVSEGLFRLVTESVRLRSNETRRLETLTSLVGSQVAEDSPSDDPSPHNICEHFSILPSSGDVRLDLVLPTDVAEKFLKIQQRFEGMLHREITVCDTLSILLFRYVIARKTAGVLRTLGLEDRGPGVQTQAKIAI